MDTPNEGRFGSPETVSARRDDENMLRAARTSRLPEGIRQRPTETEGRNIRPQHNNNGRKMGKLNHILSSRDALQFQLQRISTGPFTGGNIFSPEQTLYDDGIHLDRNVAGIRKRLLYLISTSLGSRMGEGIKKTLVLHKPKSVHIRGMGSCKSDPMSKPGRESGGPVGKGTRLRLSLRLLHSSCEQQ